ncbi:hypothetical protein [Nocardiopsis dassonvillei]|uniref:hypothetical protein n=1 Tax=Nocardiopsis dassonvillei TaxID=2014 RepID=UPI0036407047
MLSELPTWLASPGLWIGGFAALVTGVTVIGVGARKVARLLRRAGHLLDDLMGEPPRPGHPEGRPGLMERVASLEESVDEVRDEVRHNHGGSLKDAVRRIEGAVADLSSKVEK